MGFASLNPSYGPPQMIRLDHCLPTMKRMLQMPPVVATLALWTVAH